VAQGDKALSTQPLGASKKTSPMANAACGTASKGASQRTPRGHKAWPKVRDKRKAAPATAKAVDIKPVHKLMPKAARV
jgi:hypothetical protein